MPTRETTFQARPAVRGDQAQVPGIGGGPVPGRAGERLGQAAAQVGAGMMNFATQRREFNRQRESRLYGISLDSEYRVKIARLEELARRDPQADQSEVWAAEMDQFKAIQLDGLSDEDPFRNDKMRVLDELHTNYLSRLQGAAVRFESEANARNAVDTVNRAFHNLQSQIVGKDFSGMSAPDVFREFDSAMNTLRFMEEEFSDNPAIVNMARKRMTAELLRTANRSDVSTEAAMALADQVTDIDPQTDYGSQIEQLRRNRQQIDHMAEAELNRFVSSTVGEFMERDPVAGSTVDPGELASVTGEFLTSLQGSYGFSDEVKAELVEQAREVGEKRQEEVRLNPSASRKYAQRLPEASEIAQRWVDAYSALEADITALAQTGDPAEIQDLEDRINRNSREVRRHHVQYNRIVQEGMRELGNVSLDEAWNIPDELEELFLHRIERAGTGFEKAQVAKAISHTLHGMTPGYIESIGDSHPEAAAILYMAYLNPDDPNIEELARNIGNPDPDGTRQKMTQFYGGNEDRAANWDRMFDRIFHQHPFYVHSIHSDNVPTGVVNALRGGLKRSAADAQIRRAEERPEQGFAGKVWDVLTWGGLAKIGSVTERPISEMLRTHIDNKATVLNLNGEMHVIPNRYLPYQSRFQQLISPADREGYANVQQAQREMQTAMDLTISRQEYGGVIGWLEAATKEDLIADWEQLAQGNANLDFSTIMLPSTEASRQGALSDIPAEMKQLIFGRSHSAAVENLIIDQNMITAKFHENDEGDLHMYFYWKGGTYDPRDEGVLGTEVRQLGYEPMWRMDENGNKTEQISIPIDALRHNSWIISNHRRAQVRSIERGANRVIEAIGERQLNHPVRFMGMP